MSNRKSCLLFILFGFYICFYFISCSGKTQIIKDELDKTLSASTDTASMISDLLALDQKYPRSVLIKSHLGISYILNNDIGSASVFLNSAEKNLKKSTPADTKYLVYAGLADVTFFKKDYAASKQYAELALKEDEKDTLGIICVLARDEMELDNEKGALTAYSEAFKNKGLFLNESDYDNYLGLLARNGKWHDALRVYFSLINTRGFTTGDGLMISSLYEKTSEYDKSLSAAMFELYDLYIEKKITSDEIRAKASELKTVIKNKLDSESYIMFLEQLDGYVGFINGRFADAYSVFRKYSLFNGDSFQRFFYYVSEFTTQVDKIQVDEIARYVELESIFQSNQGYYFHLWNAMKRGEGSYTYNGIKDVLNKTLDVGKNSRYVSDTKKEIGRLLGIPENECDYVITRQNVLVILDSFLSTKNPVTLDPICGLLSITNNPYTDECISILREFRDKKALRDAMDKNTYRNNSLLKTRLLNIFG